MLGMLHNGGKNARQLDSLYGSENKSSQDQKSDTGKFKIWTRKIQLTWVLLLILMFNLTDGKGITIFVRSL
jgi:hypothetical protein